MIYRVIGRIIFIGLVDLDGTFLSLRSLSMSLGAVAELGFFVDSGERVLRSTLSLLRTSRSSVIPSLSLACSLTRSSSQLRDLEQYYGTQIVRRELLII